MKTIREWLKELPDGYRELALKNINENFVPYVECGGRTASLKKALLHAFGWGESPEGAGFWDRVHDYLYSRGPLPKLPSEVNPAKSPSTESIPEPAEDHPLCKINYSASNDVRVEVSESELRDRFALAAMQGWLSSFGPNDIHPVANDVHRSLAQQSYTLAQAMVEARKEYVKG